MTKNINGWLLSHAKDVVAVLVLIGMVSAGMSHFATAADVEKKFKILETSIRAGNLESRKIYIEDQLFRLRAEGANTSSTRAQIARFESELRDVQAKLRDLERPK